MIRLDTELAEIAKHGMGIQESIQLRLAAIIDPAKNTAARHRWCGSYHLIEVTYHDPHHMTFLLLHEWAHALQSERMGHVNFHNAYVEQLFSHGANRFAQMVLPREEFLANYASVPFEREADEIAQMVQDVVGPVFVDDPAYCPTGLLDSYRID